MKSSTEINAWRSPFGTPGRFDRSRSGMCSWGQCANESSFTNLFAGVWSPREVEASMTAEHIKVVLESERDCSSLWRMCQEFARGHMPPEILQAVRIGRMTALQKPQGGIRGIVVGDFVRRVVARTLAQQLGPAVEQHTSPFTHKIWQGEGGEQGDPLMLALSCR